MSVAPIPQARPVVSLSTGLIDFVWQSWLQGIADGAAATVVNDTQIVTTKTIVATEFIGHIDGSQITGNIGWGQLPASAGTWVANPSIQGTLTTQAINVNGLATFSSSVVPAQPDTSTLGTPAVPWKAAYISQINATVFALTTQTLFGGYSTVGKNAGQFAAKLPSSLTQVDFGQTMTVGDFILIRANDQTAAIKFEYLQVGSLVSGTVYNITRDLAHAWTYPPDWPAGTPYLVLGSSGTGRIDLLAFDGKPRIVFTLQGATYNAESDRAVIGNLNTYYGYTSDIFGACFGDFTAANLTIDPTNGLRIRQGSTVYAQMASSVFTLGLSSGNRVQWDGTNLTVVSANLTINQNGVVVVPAATAMAWSQGNGYTFTDPGALGFGMVGGQDVNGYRSVLIEANQAATGSNQAEVQMTCSLGGGAGSSLDLHCASSTVASATLNVFATGAGATATVTIGAGGTLATSAINLNAQTIAIGGVLKINTNLAITSTQYGAFNDASNHILGVVASCWGVAEVGSTAGITSIPFYGNGGAGVGWHFTCLNPGTGWVVNGNGVSFSFTDGSGTNTYTFSIASGSGAISITRTAGSASYTVLVTTFQ